MPARQDLAGGPYGTRTAQGSERTPSAPAGLALAILVGSLVASGCAHEPVELVGRREAMSTVVMVRVIAPTEALARRALDAAWKEMDECVGRLNRYAEDSDIARVNRQAGLGEVAVDPLVASCLAAAKEVYEMSGGAFDPTVGPILALWRQAEKRGEPPTDEAIARVLKRIGMDKVEISADMPPVALAKPLGPRYLVRLKEKGMMLDLGGVAKGYIAGRMMRRIERVGATAALIDVGGDVCGMGERPANLTRQGRPRRWGVAVQDPRYPPKPPKHPGRLYTAVHVRDRAVVTSGHYHRGYTIAGTRYSHIVDPRTGRPVDTRLASVTVAAPDPALADGLATAIAVLGIQEGLALVEKTPNVECLLLEKAPAESQSKTAEDRLIAHRSSGFAALEFTPSQ